MRIMATALSMLLLFAATTQAQTGPGTGHMGYMNTMPFGGWSMIALIVVIGMIFILLIRGSSIKRKTKTPLEILKERYARGEIDHEEFETIRKKLEE